MKRGRSDSLSEATDKKSGAAVSTGAGASESFTQAHPWSTVKVKVFVVLND
jgi:hypothetical protein